MNDCVIELTDADVVEDPGEDLLTGEEAAEAVRIRDHQIAINTAQELIHQRGILMEDLEVTLNAARRHRQILYDHGLPDPYAEPIRELLKKYRMSDGLNRDEPYPMPGRKELEESKPKELANPCQCGRSAEQRWHRKGCPLRKHAMPIDPESR